MNTPDLIAIIGNISHSLYPVQHFITGGAYLLSILFFIIALAKLKKIADTTTQSHSQEKMYSPLMYLLLGAALLYLPSAFSVLANSAFGVGNVLTYSSYSPSNIFSSMGLLIQTAGILWFIRGCVLVAHASQPGTKLGPKGLVFIVAGILAMNFDNTIAMLNYAVNNIIQWSMSFK